MASQVVLRRRQTEKIDLLGRLPLLQMLCAESDFRSLDERIASVELDRALPLVAARETGLDFQFDLEVRVSWEVSSSAPILWSRSLSRASIAGVAEKVTRGC